MRGDNFLPTLSRRVVAFIEDQDVGRVPAVLYRRGDHLELNACPFAVSNGRLIKDRLRLVEDFASMRDEPNALFRANPNATHFGGDVSLSRPGLQLNNDASRPRESFERRNGKALLIVAKAEAHDAL